MSHSAGSGKQVRSDADLATMVACVGEAIARAGRVGEDAVISCDAE